MPRTPTSRGIYKAIQLQRPRHPSSLRKKKTVMIIRCYLIGLSPSGMTPTLRTLGLGPCHYVSSSYGSTFSNRSPPGTGLKCLGRTTSWVILYERTGVLKPGAALDCRCLAGSQAIEVVSFRALPPAPDRALAVELEECAIQIRLCSRNRH